MKYMQFVGIGKLIDIVYENENCINFFTEADDLSKHYKSTEMYIILYNFISTT